MNKEELIAAATKMAKKFIRPAEELSLRAYPDPYSALGKVLETHLKARAYRDGKFIIPADWLKLSPEPVTIGYGSTFKGLKLGTVWTLEQAESALDHAVVIRIGQVLKAAPVLLNHSPEKLAACVSLQYNIGESAFAQSTLVKLLNQEDMQGAADQFPRWNKAKGQVSNGLTNRRAAERALFVSVKG